MRILVAHSFYRISGGEDRYVEQQVDLLRQRHEVELLARRNTDLEGGLATARRMTFSRAQKSDVDAVVRDFRPEIIHLHNAYPSLGPSVHLASQKRSIPLVMTVHNFRLRCPNGYQFTEGALCRRCEKGLYHNAVMHRCFSSRAQALGYATALWTHRFVLGLDRKVALYITPSAFMRSRMLEWGFEDSRVEVVRNFTDVSGAAAEPGSFGLSLGRISPEKGIDVLLHALAKAGDPPFKIAGDGPVLEDLTQLSSRLGLRNTEFLGRISSDEVPTLLARSRFVVLPSLWDENAPLAALEAMAMGRPLLVTNTGGLVELVQHGEGLTCTVGDVEELGASIYKLMSDDNLCRETGALALRRARQEFVPEEHLKRLEGAYERARKLPRS